MRRNRKRGTILLHVMFALGVTLQSLAAPVGRDGALRAAKAELPRYYAGPWQLASEQTMHDLEGNVQAYTFVFSHARAEAKASAPDADPAQFIAKARRNLAAAGKAISGNEPQLYGRERFASIVVNADDTEPVVLRCFKGLPPHLVKASNAKALAAQRRGGAWRTRRYLMLGLFDEALLMESPDGKDAVVVDMRTRSVVTREVARERALRKKRPTPSEEQARQCRKAWAPHLQAEGGEKRKSAPIPPKTAKPKSAEIGEMKDYAEFTDPPDHTSETEGDEREGLR